MRGGKCAAVPPMSLRVKSCRSSCRAAKSAMGPLPDAEHRATYRDQFCEPCRGEFRSPFRILLRDDLPLWKMSWSSSSRIVGVSIRISEPRKLA